ncbi:MAG: PhzF family phenazine biosynthesis protein [Reinekea sp.]
MSRARRFVTADVFTQRCFGGNPLAVVLDAEELTSEQMQSIAREFNYSESTFVLPAENGGDYKVRIFTPSAEVPFAGHPNIGTAVVLAAQGLLPETGRFVFEEQAGNVPVAVTGSNEQGWSAELTAPEPLMRGQTFDPALIADILSVPVSAICTDAHLPQQCSVGLPFVLVELASLDALQQVVVNPQHLEQLSELTNDPFLHVYVRSDDNVDIRTRMFAPTDGIPEDPATGSANCALAALLADLDAENDGQYKYRIAQGVEMGRPSELLASVEKHNGILTAVRIAGNTVVFSHGMLVGAG